jgi:hypothetical protein
MLLPDFRKGFLAFALVFYQLCAGSVSARTVAVVYDNSASMAGENKIEYASYSLQLLRAFMREGDRLLVVSMSGPGRVSFRSSDDPASDIPKLLSLSRHAQGETPYLAVKTAISELEKTKDREKWLIVITDGIFNGMPDQGPVVARDLKRIAGLKTVLLGIAIPEKVTDGWKYAGAETLASPPSSEITDNMRKIAAMVTSGAGGGGLDFKMTADGKGRRATFTSAFPLRSFAVLQQTADQREPARVIRAEADGGSLSVSKAALDARTPDEKKKLLRGRVIHVTPGGNGRLIPSGVPIDIFFEGEVSEQDLTILPEAAVDLSVTIRDALGKTVSPDDMKRFSLCSGDRIRVTARFLFPQGVTAPSALKDVKVLFSLNGKEEPMAFDPSSGGFSCSLTVPGGDSPVSTKAEYPGYIHILDNGRLIGKDDCPPRKFALGLKRGGENVTAWSAGVCDICDGKADPLTFTVEEDGRPLTPDEALDWTVTADKDSGFPFSIERTTDGLGWSLVPKTRFGSPCLSETGVFSIITVMNGKESPGVPGNGKPCRIVFRNTSEGPRDTFTPRSVSVEVGNPGWFTRCRLFAVKAALFLVFLWWLAGVLKKPRFARKSLVEFERTGPGAKKDYDRLPGNVFGRWLVPYVPEKKTVDSVTFIATGSPSVILVSRKSIRQLGSNLLFNGRPKPGAERADRDEKINTTTKLEFVSGRSRTKYSYVRPSGAAGRSRRS